MVHKIAVVAAGNFWMEACNYVYTSDVNFNVMGYINSHFTHSVYLKFKCVAAEPKLIVRRGSDTALCRGVVSEDATSAATSDDCSTDSTVVSALQQLTSYRQNSVQLPLYHSPAKHPVCFNIFETPSSNL